MIQSAFWIAGPLLICALAAHALAGEECSGPTTGEIVSGEFDFTYESWQKKQSKTGKFRFERCVQNNHKRDLWVDWDSTGLKGTTKSDDASWIYFDETKDDKEEEERALWYGPAPDRIDPTTVLRPVEANRRHEGDARVWLAQFQEGLDLADALADKELLTRILGSLPDDQQITMRSGGRIAVPTRDGAMDDLRNPDARMRPTDFIAVQVFVVERLTLNDGVPVGSLSMRFFVNPRDFVLLESTGGRPPVITISSRNQRLQSRLLPEGGTFSLNRPALEFEDRAPSALQFPVVRSEGDVVIEFTDGSARLVLPFGVMSGS